MTIILLLIILFNVLPVLTLAYLYFKHSTKQIETKTEYSPISIIIACYNEGQFIQQKLDELLDVDEWIEDSEIIIISNGSNDNTKSVLEKYIDDKRLKIYLFEERIGKINSINLGINIAKNSIILFSDCRQRIKKHSVKKLIGNFANPEISLVSSAIWDNKNKLTFIRKAINFTAELESKAGICFSVHGAMYAVRKECFPTIPTDIIFDDLYVNAYIVSNNGKVCCEPNSVIYDLKFESYYKRERIERLTRGLLLFLFNHFRLLRKMPTLALQIFVWHKYAKMINPILLIILLITMLFEKLIPAEGFYIALAILLTSIVNRHIRLTFYFIIYQLRALFRFVFNINRSVDWEKLFIYRRDL